MTKRNKIIYWISTIWLSFGMVSGGIFQLLKMDDAVKSFTHLGYPMYLLSILGLWKLLGVVAILIPKFLLLKEWAYAGFFFAMTGATASHLIMGDPWNELFPSLLSLMLVVVSWHFRPEDRRMSSAPMLK